MGLRIIKSTVLGLLLLNINIYADHNDPQGSAGLLVSEAQDLVNVVSRSYLNYNVKSSVYQFNNDVGILANCVRYGLRNMLHDHLEEVGVPQRCGQQLQNLRYSFQPVARYLYDTYYDFPQVYRAYVSTQQSLNAIQIKHGGGSGGGGGSLIRCIATDSGWEEHSGGHVAYGRDAQQAQYTAIRECQRYHGQCRVNRCEYTN